MSLPPNHDKQKEKPDPGLVVHWIGSLGSLDQMGCITCCTHYFFARIYLQKYFAILDQLHFGHFPFRKPGYEVAA